MCMWISSIFKIKKQTVQHWHPSFKEGKEESSTAQENMSARSWSSSERPRVCWLFADDIGSTGSQFTRLTRPVAFQKQVGLLHFLQAGIWWKWCFRVFKSEVERRKMSQCLRGASPPPSTRAWSCSRFFPVKREASASGFCMKILGLCKTGRQSRWSQTNEGWQIEIWIFWPEFTFLCWNAWAEQNSNRTAWTRRRHRHLYRLLISVSSQLTAGWRRCGGRGEAGEGRLTYIPSIQAVCLPTRSLPVQSQETGREEFPLCPYWTQPQPHRECVCVLVQKYLFF